MNIFVIDKATKNNLAMTDFIPRKEERIVIDAGWKIFKCVVETILYKPKEHTVYAA